MALLVDDIERDKEQLSNYQSGKINLTLEIESLAGPGKGRRRRAG